MNQRLLFVTARCALAPLVILGTGVSTVSASAPPTSAASEEAVGAGLRALLDDLGTVTYTGDDITVGDCPLADATETAAALTGLTDVELVADEEAQIEMLADYEMDETFAPVAVSCEFESTADDSDFESIGIVAADPNGEGAADLLDSFDALLDVDVADEPAAAGGELRGACEEAECLYLWSGNDAVIITFLEFDDEHSPDPAAVAAAVGELVDTVAAESG